MNIIRIEMKMDNETKWIKIVNLESLRKIFKNTCTLSRATVGSEGMCINVVSAISRTTPIRNVAQGAASPKADLNRLGMTLSSFSLRNKYDDDQDCKNHNTSLTISGLMCSSMPFLSASQRYSARFNIFVMSTAKPLTKIETRQEISWMRNPEQKSGNQGIRESKIFKRVLITGKLRR